LAKSEKYKPLCVSKLLFWRQKWVAGARRRNSLVVRRVPAGKIIVVFFLTKHAVPRQIKPGILKLTTCGGRRKRRTIFYFIFVAKRTQKQQFSDNLAAKKTAVIVSFR